MMGVVGLTLRALVLAQHRLGTSSKLHTKLCDVTLGAPISFFDVTPTGKYVCCINYYSPPFVYTDIFFRFFYLYLSLFNSFFPFSFPLSFPLYYLIYVVLFHLKFSLFLFLTSFLLISSFAQVVF